MMQLNVWFINGILTSLLNKIYNTQNWFAVDLLSSLHTNMETSYDFIQTLTVYGGLVRIVRILGTLWYVGVSDYGVLSLNIRQKKTALLPISILA